MGLDERSEAGFPQHIRQAGVAVQLVVALDETPAMSDQDIRKQAEVDVLNRFEMSLIGCLVGIFRNEFHHSARGEPTNLADASQHMSRGIYLRWMNATVFIEKKYPKMESSDALVTLAMAKKQ